LIGSNKFSPYRILWKSMGTAWEKTQELRSGEYSLWDHCFDLPGKHLEAKRKTIDSVDAGEVTHKLGIGGNDQLKIYDYPGGYAQRFNGIDRNGAPRPQDLQNIFPDSERTGRAKRTPTALVGCARPGSGPATDAGRLTSR
jgi:type VI secretion system secreted protein VgrG